MRQEFCQSCLRYSKEKKKKLLARHVSQGCGVGSTGVFQEALAGIHLVVLSEASFLFSILLRYN